MITTFYKRCSTNRVFKIKIQRRHEPVVTDSLNTRTPRKSLVSESTGQVDKVVYTLTAF